MLFYSAYDVVTGADNSYLIEPVAGSLEFFKAEEVPKGSQQQKKWNFKIRRLAEQKTDVGILKLIPNYSKTGQYQIQLMGSDWFYDDPNADFFDEVVGRFDVTSARGKSNILNLLNGASIIVGTVAATPKGTLLSADVRDKLKKFEQKMKAIKPHVKRIANFVNAANEVCSIMSEVISTEATAELKLSPTYMSSLYRVC